MPDEAEFDYSEDWPQELEAIHRYGPFTMAETTRLNQQQMEDYLYVTVWFLRQHGLDKFIESRLDIRRTMIERLKAGKRLLPDMSEQRGDDTSVGHSDEMAQQAIALAQNGQLKRGLKILEQYCDDLRYVNYWFSYGCMFHSAGDPANAAKCLYKATSLNNAHTDAWAKLGVVLQGAGEHKLAIQAWDICLDMSPPEDDVPTLKYNIGTSHEALGNSREARRWYQQALRSDPEFAQAGAALSRLQRGGRRP